MIFNSYIFLFAFLPITFGVFWLLKNKQHKYIWLTLTGYVFYGYWSWKFAILMFITTVIDFTIASWIEKNSSNAKKMKLGVVLSIVSNLAILGYFKYAGFLTGSFVNAIEIFGFNLPAPNINIVLPVGISFYTFQAMSYVIDVYRRQIQATKNFFEYSTYIALFPQLVAGPIVRYKDIVSDLDNIEKQAKSESFFRGINLFIIGLVKKVVLADSIAAIINPMLGSYSSLTTLGAWLAIFGYTYQLYFDFSGYSDMAIGLGHLFGFKFLQNFNSPYKAKNISDFWRRWHISLSTWLRDYLYIPLGGSRLSPSRAYINLLLTMLLGGLWHGANWTFVAWGVYHGSLLALYKKFGSWWDKLPYAFSRVATLLAVMIGWVFFRSSDFTMAWVWLGKMFSLNSFETIWSEAASYPASFLILLAGATIITQFFPNTFQINYQPKIKYAVILAAAFIYCLILLNYKQSVFIYYQF